jgi:hypothetical protein
MKTVKFTLAAASFALLPAAHAFANASGGFLAPASAAKLQILAMSDGGGASNAGSGWTPFPEKDRTAKPDASSEKETAVRVEEAAKKKAKARK